MAKKNQVFIDVVIDDKGTTKRVAVNAKKLGLELDKTATSAHTADRRIKGVANSSSNATKNFSKMAQGTGGLVAAYATLAANIFAISAAYNFLKKAGDVASLTKSQEQFAIKTGTSMKLLTSRMQEATGGMLAFEAASQAAAIGSAAGVSTDQMQSLAKAAKNTSVALGRDLTDSFNRLVKGAIKAEPELLDELGIIVRLDTVTADYAASIGKTAKQLTAFERTQAVVNAVLDQTTEKFDDVGNNVNQIARLGKSFDDLVKKIMKIINPIAQFAGGVLADNIEALAAAFGVLGISIAKGLAPAAPALADISSAAAAAKSRMAGIATDSAIGKNIQSGDIGQREIRAIQVAANANSTSVLNMSKTTKTAVLRDLKIIKAEHELMIQANSVGWKKWAAGAKAELYTLQAEHGKVMGAMKTATANFGRFASRAFSAIAIIGMLQLALSFAREILDMLKSDELKNVERNAEELKRRYDEQNEAIAEMGNGWKGVKTNIEDVTRQVNVLNNLQLAGLEGMAKNLTGPEATTGGLLGGGLKVVPETDYKELTQMYQKSDENLELEKTFPGIRTSLTTFAKILKDTGTASKKLKSDISAVVMSMKRMEETSKGSLYGDELEIYTASIAILEEKLPGLAKRMMESGKATKAVGHAFIGATNTSKAFDKMVQNLGKSSSEFSAYLDLLGQLDNMFLSLDKTTLSLEFNKYFQKKGAEAGVLTKEGEAYLKIVGITNREELKGLTMKQAQGLLQEKSKKVLEEEFTIRLKISKLQSAFIRAGAGLTKDQGTRLKLEHDRQKTLFEIDKIETDIKRKTELTVQQDATRVKELRAQQDVLLAQLGIIERQQDEMLQLRDAATGALEGSLKTNIASVLKGEESSIKDAAIKIAQGAIGGVADKLAEQMTGKIMDKLMKVEDPAEAMKRAHKEGTEEGKSKLKKALEEGAQINYDKIVNASEVGAKAFASAIAGGDPATAEGKPALKTKWLIPSTDEEVAKAKADMNKPIDLSIFDDDKKGPGPIDEDIKKQSLLYDNGGAKNTRPNGGIVKSMKSLFTTFNTDLGEVFNKNTEGGLLGKLGTLFTNFGSGIGDIFGSILGSFGGGAGGGGSGILGLLSAGASLFGFANGGIVKGGFRKYANGGIASSPHIGVIGEGKYNEAVVPLPDGRSIPVTPGAGMGTNNVTVNVNIDNEGKAESSTQSDSSMGADLGKLVARAVQEELQYQKRSGGILNPYGAA